MQGQNQMKFSMLALLALAMVMIVAAVPAAYAQNTVGTITQIQGTANIQRSGATIAAAQNMPIFLHDKIVTDPNASLTIGLVDNSSLQLGASSTLTIDESVLVNGVGAPSKVGLLGGDLRSSIVGAMRGGSTTFEVHTPNAIGAVRGTEWTEHYDEQPREGSKDCRQNTDVAVQDGTVLVCNTANPPECKDIHKGQHTTIRCGAYWEGAGLGGFGLGALGALAAGGIGVGAAAGAGAFNGPNNPPPPHKHSPSE
ncbi:MAG: FecR family protein [Candidatus Binatus sp.]